MKTINHIENKIKWIKYYNFTQHEWIELSYTPNPIFTDEFCEAFQFKLNWPLVFKFQTLSSEIIEKLFPTIIKNQSTKYKFECFDAVASHQKVSSTFINNYLDLYKDTVKKFFVGQDLLFEYEVKFNKLYSC